MPQPTSQEYDSQRGITGRFMRRRLVVTITLFTVILSILFTLWALVGVRTMRRALIAETERQSLALLESLILASQYSLTTATLVDQMENDARLADVEAAANLLGASVPSDEKIAEILESFEADGFALWQSGQLVRAAPESLGILIVGRADLTIMSDDDSLPSTLEIIDSATHVRWRGTAVGNENNTTALWERFETDMSPPSIGGIGELVQQIGTQSGINYILLQSPDGIVFASRPLKPILKLAADSFLVRVLENDSADTREIEFEGTHVLEAAAPFLSLDLPSGVFRVGLNLEAVDDAVSRLSLQFGLTALLLILLSTAISAILIARRSLASLGESYREVETLTGRVLDAIDQAVIVIDRTGRIRLLNPTAERWFGVDVNEAIGTAVTEVLPEENFSLMSAMGGTTTHGETEVSYRLPSGVRALVYSTTALVSPNGSITGAVAVIRDETEPRALAAEMRRAERLSSMGQLAAGVAHEVRNPLNAIALGAQRLKLELNDPESMKLADTIWDESKRLNALVQDFLSLARPSTQPRQSVELDRLAQDVAQMARLEADKKQVGMTVDIQSDTPVFGVPDDLRKALWNLLANALAATPSGGDIHVTMTTTGRRASLTIDDTGEGIPPESLPRIFEPWFTTKPGGTGLGLAITHRIIRDHDGSIEVTSPLPGRSEGTRVTVTLPVERQSR